MQTRPRSVLIIEADPIQKDLMRLVLSRYQWQVATTSDPEEAISLLDENPPDMLVIDTFLPGTNGLDLLKQLQNSRRLDHTGVVVISAFGFQEIVRQAIQLGARDFLIKPLDMDQFAERMNQLFAGETSNH
jgi:DNA-binding NtrC family response regulator